MRALSAVLAVGLLVGVLAPTFARAGDGPGPGGAFLRSLVVPGWGQRAAGHRAAAVFAGTEVGLWGAYVGLLRLADVRADNYRGFAARHAGAQTSGKDGAFFDDLGFYASVRQHNQYAAYEDGPQPDLYPMTPEYFWEWESDAARLEYRDLRNGSRSARRQGLYVAGLVAVNHLLAAVHAARVAGGAAPTSEAAGVEPLVLAWDAARNQVRLAWVGRF